MPVEMAVLRYRSETAIRTGTSLAWPNNMTYGIQSKLFVGIKAAISVE